MTLKIRSRSLKSNQLFCLFQQCIYLSLVQIYLLNQKITHRNPISTFKSLSVTLKIRLRLSISNQHFPSYQQYIYASLVKIHPLVQKITQGIHISDNSKCCCDLENKVKCHRNLINLALPTMYQCNFDQNPTTGSEDNART